LTRLDLEALYQRLPIPVQHAACSVVGWRTEHTRYDATFSEILAETVARTFWSAEELAAYRDRRVAEFVEHAARTTSFYAARLRAGSLAPSQVRSLEDLESLPILTKHEAQEHQPELVSSGIGRRQARSTHTSGTTGGALVFPTTPYAVQQRWAVVWRYRTWHRIERGTWCALFAGRAVVPAKQKNPPFWRLNAPGRQLLFSGYHMSPETLPSYVDVLRKRRPPWLHGYPSLLALLAAYVLESGIDPGYDVRWVTTGAENLLPHQSAVIQRAFGVEPIQHYGLTEGVAQISQCELKTLHIDEDYAGVEFVPVGEHGLHRVIGTNFTNPAFPLLRYDTDDMVVVRDGATCSCGRAGRVVERIDGRLEDYVILRNNTRVGRMDHIFKDMINIQEAQIYQRRPGEITIRVVRGRNYGETDEEQLRREIAKRVGDEIDVAVEYWDALPRTQTGKLRFVVSDVPGGSIEPIAPASPARGAS